MVAMTTARHLRVDPASPGFYHCISRYVPRAWLCGVNAFSACQPHPARLLAANNNIV